MRDKPPVDLLRVERVLATTDVETAVDSARSGDAEAVVIAALALMSRGRGTSARIIELLSATPPGVRDPSLTAFAAWAQAESAPDRSKEAENSLRTIIEKYPELPLPRLLRAGLLVKHRDTWTEAIAECQEAVRQAPTSCLAWSHLAMSLATAGRHEEALGALDQSPPTCAPTALASHVEMLAGFASKRWDRATDAYVQRNIALGKRAYPRIVRLWAHRGRLISFGFGLLAAGGVALSNPWLFLAGLLGLAAFAPVAIHVTRNRRVALVLLPEVTLLAVLFLLARAFL